MLREQLVRGQLLGLGRVQLVLQQALAECGEVRLVVAGRGEERSEDEGKCGDHGLDSSGAGSRDGNGTSLPTCASRVTRLFTSSRLCWKTPSSRCGRPCRKSNQAAGANEPGRSSSRSTPHSPCSSVRSRQSAN